MSPPHPVLIIRMLSEKLISYTSWLKTNPEPSLSSYKHVDSPEAKKTDQYCQKGSSETLVTARKEREQVKETLLFDKSASEGDDLAGMESVCDSQWMQDIPHDFLQTAQRASVFEITSVDRKGLTPQRTPLFTHNALSLGEKQGWGCERIAEEPRIQYILPPLS